MWNCGRCGEIVDDDLEMCWNCETERFPTEARSSAPTIHETSLNRDGSPPSGPLRMAAQLERRYRDAYRAARWTISFGSLIKLLAVVVGAISIAGAAALVKVSTEIGVLVGFLGIVAGLSLYANGVLISAQGQLVQSSVDGVINTSPFLDDSERAAIMRIEFDEMPENTGHRQ